MTDPMVFRDERAASVENASYRWGYLTLAFGLLVISAVRSFVLHQQTWDLLGLVVVGGGVAASYQALKRVVTRRGLLLAGAAAVLALVIGAILVRLH
jgi:hypothetical protein